MTLPITSLTTRATLTVILLFSLPFATAANKALVIGNNNYEGDVLSRLANPIRDARTVADALRDIGFSVTQKENLSHQQFSNAIKDFAQNLQPSDIAFIYYAGHGLAYANNDYLLPVSPPIELQESVEFKGINAQEILNIVSNRSMHTVFVVDACRDNPFIRSGGSRGVGFMKPNRGSSYIFYAANFGEVASDDGTFARVLAQELRRPQSLDDIRAKVAEAVSERTNGNQNPNAINRLKIGTLYFLKTTAPAVPAAKPAPQNNVVSAEKLWRQGMTSYDYKDYQQARQFYEQAAAQGYAPAQNSLGYLYDEGLGVTKDYSQAKYWYEKSAAQGNKSGQNNLGYLYQHGLGVKKDYSQAKYWYEKAAAQGHADGQYNLGYLYQNGQGVAQDYSQAKYWYEKAAAQGHGEGQNQLGYFYHQGLGVTKDYSQAKYWYEKSAAQGIAFAQFNLGYLYEYGLKDSRQAKVWYEKAAAQGLSQAKEALKRF